MVLKRRQLSREEAVEQCILFRVCQRPVCKGQLPRRPRHRGAIMEFPGVLKNLGRDVKRNIFGHSQSSLEACDFVGAQRGPVNFPRVLFRGRRPSNDGLEDNQ